MAKNKKTKNNARPKLLDKKHKAKNNGLPKLLDKKHKAKNNGLPKLLKSAYEVNRDGKLKLQEKKKKKKYKSPNDIILDGHPVNDKDLLLNFQKPNFQFYDGAMCSLRNDKEEYDRVKAEKEKLMEERKKEEERCVVKLSSIPEGFGHTDIRKYFEQFGEVTKSVLVKSEKTGQSRHFAFIQFKYANVAKIAAETMNNYVTFKRVMKACVIDPTIAEEYWRTENYMPKNCPGHARRSRNAVQINSTRSHEKDVQLRRKRVAKLAAKMKKLRIRGINYVYWPQINEKIEQERKEAEEIEKEREEKRREMEKRKEEKEKEEERKRMEEEEKEKKKRMEEEEKEKKKKEENEKQMILRPRGVWKGKQKQLPLESGVGVTKNVVKMEGETGRSRQIHESASQFTTDKEPNKLKRLKKFKSMIAARREKKLLKNEPEEKGRKIALKGWKNVKHDIPGTELDGTFSSLSSDSNKLVMEIDESDTEIEFKTPPNVIKRKLQKRSYAKRS